MNPATKPTASIDDLPPEMICELFKHLGLEDLIVCSRVNRRWYSIQAAFKLHRLFAIGNDPSYELNQWRYPDRRVEEVERCSLAMLRRLIEKPLLSNLKHLALSGCSNFDLLRYDYKFDLNELNRFQQLVHLEISIGWFAEAELNLPKLKVLVIHHFNRDCSLWIDCPELSTLVYYTFQAHLLKVKHPETIRMLETDLDGQLALFKGVECLVTKKFQVISKATLLSLPRLRELHFDQDIESFFSREQEFRDGITVDRVKRTLSEFLADAEELRGDDFRLTFCGLQLTYVDVDQIDFGVQVDEVYGRLRERVCNEYVYMKNYHLIEPDALHFISLVDYNLLLSHVIGEFPRCFSQKFIDIEVVKVHGVVKDPDHLLWFLKSLRYLRDLWLGAALSQKFYDQLPAAAHSLISLKLRDLKNELHLNFDFIGLFSSLSKLEITLPLSLNSATSLVRWSDRLKNSPVIVRSEGIWIEKECRSTLWRVRDETGRLVFQTENPDEMIEFFEGVQEVVNYFDRAQKPVTSPASE